MYTNWNIIKDWKLHTVMAVKSDGLFGKKMDKGAKIVKGSGPHVYLLLNGKKQWITNPKTFNALHFSWKKI